jgi:hypothetical protein
MEMMCQCGGRSQKQEAVVGTTPGIEDEMVGWDEVEQFTFVMSKKKTEPVYITFNLHVVK